MMHRLLFIALSIALASPVRAQDLPPIAEKTQGMTRLEGYFPLFWDPDAGKIWLAIPRLNEEFLYVVSQPAGLGSNDIGLDRTQLGSEQVVYFDRVGPKILLKAPNLRFRATSGNAAEEASVRDAFASSVAWGFTAAAESGDSVLVDATDFIVRDGHGVSRRLREAGQGSFHVDQSRSAVYLPSTKSFPENTEMEALLTFTTDAPGQHVNEVAADPFAVTLRVRHSFVQLPSSGFEPRRFDPRSGYYDVSYRDYSTPIGEEMDVRFIARHRVREGEPIVYYLDPGTPEPVRSALLDGARWWSEAFDAAGLPGTYRVEMLPEGADPLDVRYNVIQWVHRSTRGWSYGSTITDPRTGEIIKGHVLLGSLRLRQDYLIAEGLLSPYHGDYAAGYPPEEDPMLEMALARIRQLSAHEVGHTLGLAHNFAASVDGRASVMDYPAPLATLEADGSISLDNAYDVGVGAWDVVAIRYGYTLFPDSLDEREALESILEDAHRSGLHYITDEDARPAGAAHPLANLWDNGTEPVANLQAEMRLREVALQSFGLGAIRDGRPIATLEEALVPLYLHHRYQVEATARAVGGVTYSYAMRGDEQPLPEPVPAALQRSAVDALLATLHPEALALPRNLRMHLPPRPPGYGQHRELFGRYSGLTFDPYAPAEVAATMVIEALLNPERAARMVYQEDFDEKLPGWANLLERAHDSIWKSKQPGDPYMAELRRLVQQVWVDELLDLAARDDLAPAVRAGVHQHLRNLHKWLDEQWRSSDTDEIAHRAQVYDDIDRYLFREYKPGEKPGGVTTPPGAPIGSDIRILNRRRLLQAWTDDCTW